MTTKKQNLTWLFRPTFKREKQFSYQKTKKCRINLNKSIYTRTSILDLSKVLMQDFIIILSKNKYGDKAEMLLRDNKQPFVRN